MKQNAMPGTLSRLFTRAALAAGLVVASAFPATAAINAPRPGSPDAASYYNGQTTAPAFAEAARKKGSGKARSNKRRAARATTPARPAWSPPKASIVMDYDSGVIVSQNNAEELRHPASLTKIMTLMLAFDALRDGTIKPGQDLTVSAHAAARPPVKLGLKAGATIKIEDAMKLVATKSTNDMAAVIAEAIGGTEADFAILMTAKAKSLGMDKTVFKNASGLPHSEQVTTALDMAVMTRHLIKNYEAEYDEYIGERSVVYKGRTYTATNRLLGRYQGMDGVKTGYINASGFNLIASAERKGRRVIGVVFGGTSAKSRDNEMVRLLDAGFKAVRTLPLHVPLPPLRPPADDPAAPTKTMAPGIEIPISPVIPMTPPPVFKKRAEADMPVVLQRFAVLTPRLMP